MPPTQSTDTAAWPWSEPQRGVYFLSSPAKRPRQQDSFNNNTETVTRRRSYKAQGKITEYFKAQLKPQKKFDKVQINGCAVHLSGTVVPPAAKLPLVFQEKSVYEPDFPENGLPKRVSVPPPQQRKSLNRELSQVVTSVFRKPTGVPESPPLPSAPDEDGESVLPPKPKTPSVDSAQKTACSTPNPPSPAPSDSTSPLSVSTIEHCSDKPSLPSPILRTPSIIRFPARNGWKGHFLSDIVCRWSACDESFSTTSALLEHLQAKHVNTQSLSETFVCLWTGCKVYDRASCSRSWLERHVLSHGGNKPFRCIVDGCGHRFSSQTMLERHVNQHLNQSENSSSSGASSKRNLDAMPNKLFRRNGKKLRYRRQPFSARMFDYMDSGIMEGVQHSLLAVSKLQSVGQMDSTAAGNTVTLHSKLIGRRTSTDGTTNVLLRWFPLNIVADEWVPESQWSAQQVRQVPWKQCEAWSQAPLFRHRPSHQKRKQTSR